MASWNEILKEVEDGKQILPSRMIRYNFDSIIKKYLQNFSKLRNNRNIIVYYSDWFNRIKGPNIDLNDGDMDAFINAVHDLDTTKGLDLIIHTPGGDPLATEAIVKYLHKIFKDDIEIFVPRMAMSAGTMLACSAKCIWMSSHSFLGPIDPQFNGIAAYNIKKEFEEAKKELIEKPETFRNWQIILSKYPQAFYYMVNDSIELSSKLVLGWLTNYMFTGEQDAKEKAKKIVTKINANVGSHSKHFDIDECKGIGLKINNLDENLDLHDAILSIYNVFEICGSKTTMCKYVVNQKGKALINHGIMNLGVR